ncbi:MAG: hypothetical protein ACREUK_12130 [Burkholderiales bacterium]
MTPEGVKRARLKLALIGLIFALPFALAWAAYRLHWTPGDTANYGELVQPPRQVPDGGLGGLDGKPFSLASLRGKWVMLQFDADNREGVLRLIARADRAKRGSA